MLGMLCTSAARARRQRQEADRDVQAVGEGLDLAGAGRSAEVREDLHRVARLRPLRGGVGILDRIGDPEPPAVVEGEVERLLDLGLGGDELDLEARRDMDRLALLDRASAVETTTHFRREPDSGRRHQPARPK